MKVYTIRQLIIQLNREEQTAFYKELRESLGYDATTLSRKINKKESDTNDFDASDMPFICATVSKYIGKSLKIEDLYTGSKKLVSSR